MTTLKLDSFQLDELARRVAKLVVKELQKPPKEPKPVVADGQKQVDEAAFAERYGTLVRPPGTPTQPRSPVTPSPFVTRAKNLRP